METKSELTVEEKLELSMQEWKSHLLSLQHGNEQDHVGEKYQLIRLALAGSTRQPVDIHHTVNHYG